MSMYIKKELTAKYYHCYNKVQAHYKVGIKEVISGFNLDNYHISDLIFILFLFHSISEIQVK